jgi:hypothetical protein
LFRRDDLQLGRPVLVELRDQPAEGDTLSTLRTMAAAGGPHVQRVLTLSDDGRAVTYELCEGPQCTPAALPPTEATLIAEAERALAAAGVPAPEIPRSVALTPGGPVLLLVQPVSERS